jgi:hypothetical protein
MVDAGAFLVADITMLASLRQTADTLAKRHDSEVDELKANAEREKDAPKKQILQNDLARRKGLAEGLRGAMALFDTWFTKLTTPDDKGVVGLVTIAKERAIVDQLNNGGKLLAIKVQKAGGSFMTKKNLWTFFGGMPLYHMGGASVSYALMDGTTGQIGASGVVPVYGGFVKAGQLKDELGK